MALVNRDKDQSEQREVLSYSFGVIGTGATLLLGPIPYPCQVLAMTEAAIGLSGSPVHSLFLNRFVPGAGVTSIGLAATLTITAYGTSGTLGFSTASFGVTTPFQGSTTVTTLQANDIIVLNTSVANTAVGGMTVDLVLKSLQDVKTHFGV